jgi:hypothetical protein
MAPVKELRGGTFQTCRIVRVRVDVWPEYRHELPNTQHTHTQRNLGSMSDSDEGTRTLMNDTRTLAFAHI